MEPVIPLTRICIYAKDVSLVTGRSESSSRKLLRNLRLKYNKPARSYVSVYEFAEFISMSPTEIIATLKLFGRGPKLVGG